MNPFIILGALASDVVEAAKIASATATEIASSTIEAIVDIPEDIQHGFNVGGFIEPNNSSELVSEVE